MSIECNLIISILKLTKEGPVLIETVNKDAHIPTAITMKLLDKLQNEGLVYFEQDTIKVEGDSRLKLGVKAVSLGADVECISNKLCWQEFEEIAAVALQNHGYSVLNNVRFKFGGRRWEVDVVGCKKPLVLCTDCKHWQHAIAPSALRRIVNSQEDRTAALADSLPNPSLKLECTKWSNAKFIPAILSLMPCSFKFYDSVPVVPILQLQDFISQLPVYTENLKFFSRNFNRLS